MTPCACAEFTRVTIGSVEIPIGLTPILVAVVAVAILPGIVAGFIRRRRFDSAVSGLCTAGATRRERMFTRAPENVA